MVLNGEVIGLFPEGGLNTSCDTSIQPLAALPINGPTGQVIFSAQTAGRYQAQLLDAAGCHIGAPANFTILEPQTTIYSFQEGEDDYSGTQDTSIVKEGMLKDTPLGDESEIEADGVDLEDGESVILVQWALPEGIIGQVTAVNLGFEIRDPSVGLYGIYAMNAPWDEANAVWDSVNLAANQGQLLLGTIAADDTGEQSFALNADGIALVQSWKDGLIPNYGFVIRAINTDDGIQIRTKDYRRKNKRPLLEMTVLN